VKLLSLSSLPYSLLSLNYLFFWFCSQYANEASYVATMKTIRQVKTVFIIFVAFICCWSPYVFVLLYDVSDSLPLSVHLYTSMIAHLHASLNFVIYSLNSNSLGENCRHFADDLVACCCHRRTRSNVAAAVVFSSGRRCTNRRTGILSAAVSNRTLVTVECYQMQEIQG